jgi:hypothetical protein
MTLSKKKLFESAQHVPIQTNFRRRGRPVFDRRLVSSGVRCPTRSWWGPRRDESRWRRDEPTDAQLFSVHEPTFESSVDESTIEPALNQSSVHEPTRNRKAFDGPTVNISSVN